MKSTLFETEKRIVINDRKFRLVKKINEEVYIVYLQYKRNFLSIGEGKTEKEAIQNATDFLNIDLEETCIHV